MNMSQRNIVVSVGVIIVVGVVGYFAIVPSLTQPSGIKGTAIVEYFGGPQGAGVLSPCCE